MKKHHRYLPALLVLAVLLSACGAKATATPTTNPDLVLTSVAQTAIARISAIPSATPVPTETPAPTSTPTLPATMLPLSTTITGTVPAVLPTQPVSAPTAAMAGGVDRVVMVSDLDITDGTQIDAGAKFTKKWRLMNTGTSTWTTAYSLVHSSGNDIKGPASVPIPAEVAPGKIIDVAVELTAPKSEGTYTSYWKLKNASGTLFGIGASAQDAFWVKIQVGGDGNPLPTDTPAGTQTSATETPAAEITHVSLEVDNGNVQANCPHTFSYTASFHIDTKTKVTYRWEVSDPQYSVPGSSSRTFDVGDQSIPLSFEVTNNGSGWLRFHITKPVDVSSDPVDFTLDCK